MTRTRLIDVFAPKYHSLFPSIEKNAEKLVLAAEQLEVLLKTADLQKQSVILLRLNELQKISDSLTNDTHSILRYLIIVPFDKEGLKEIVNQINYLLESINKIGRILYSNRIEVKYPIYNELARIITQASNELSVCCRYFHNAGSNKKEIITCCDNLINYEKMANEAFYSGLLNLIANNEDMVLFTEMKKFLEMLINCIHQTSLVSKVIKAIIIKVM